MAALKLEAEAYRHPSSADNVVPLRGGASRSSQLTQSALHSASKASPSRPAQRSEKAAVRSLPSPASYPLWLQILISAQKGSTVLMIAAVGAMLSVYGWTVHIQDSWGQEYQKLQSLLRQERQLTTSNEALKQQIAEIAEDPKSQMTLPVPGQMLFLDPAPVREPRMVETRPPAVRSPRNAPLGY